MPLEFEHVFTGKRVGAVEEQGDTFINTALSAQEAAVVSVAGSRAVPNHGLGDFPTGGARDTDNPHPTATGWRRQCRNRVRRIEAFDHGLSLYKWRITKLIGLV